MNNNNDTIGYSPGNIRQLLEIAERSLSIRSLEELATNLLPGVVSASQSPGVLLYIDDPFFQQPCVLQHGFTEEIAATLDEVCTSRLRNLFNQANPAIIPITVLADASGIPKLHIYPLPSSGTYRRFIAFSSLPDEGLYPPMVWHKVIRIIDAAVIRCIEIAKYKQQINHLNAYMTVSSMASQALGLHELLETVLYCCIDVVAAETASVLLLDDEKKNFYFYQVEGPTKPILMKATFPADIGIAGAILRNQESEIINDIRNHPRFYGDIDSKSGFKTKNMIALPLTAGDERLGVLEVINKTNEEPFLQSERLLLISIADEISFAVRNAKIFDYVVSSYCKQRQGLNSCKGCKRPLGSWTPCMKYRQVGL